MILVLICFFTLFIILLFFMFRGIDDNVDYDKYIRMYREKLKENTILMKKNQKEINELEKILFKNKRKIKRLFK